MRHSIRSCRRWPLHKVLGIIAMLGTSNNSLAADTYHKLTDGEIKAKVTGMEISDPHFSEQYMADGTVRIVDLGRRLRGTWKIDDDELCIETPEPDGSRCKEIWSSGTKYQLRIPGDPIPFDVEIQKQQVRGW